MLTSLVTLPIRIGIRSAQLGLSVAEVVAQRALDALGDIVSPTAKPAPPRSAPPRPEAARPSSAPVREERPPARRPGAPRPGAPRPGGPRPGEGPRDPRSAAPAPQVNVEEEAEAFDGVVEPPPPPPPPPPAPVAPAPPAPAHLPEDAEVVEESAEPGAEDGAGAQIRIDEPWTGYSALNAADVIDGIGGSDAARLAAIELYEMSHRRRKTVLDAVAKEMRRVQNQP